MKGGGVVVEPDCQRDKDGIPLLTDPTQPILWFWGPYCFLSNFYSGPIKYEGREWETVEHAYQAAKTVDQGLKDRFLKCPTAQHARTLGRNIVLRPDWEEVKVGVMRELLYIKFADPRLRDMLDETGEREIVHGSMYEYPGIRFWGMKLGGRATDCPRTREREGLNMLGRLLEEVRG